MFRIMHGRVHFALCAGLFDSAPTEGGGVRGGVLVTLAAAAAVGCRYRGTSPLPSPNSEPTGRRATPLAAAAAGAFADACRFGGGDALTGDEPVDLTGDGDADAARAGVGERAVLATRGTSPRRIAAAAADGVAPHGGRSGAFAPRPLPPAVDARPLLTVGLPPRMGRGASDARVAPASSVPEPSLSGEVRTRLTAVGRLDHGGCLRGTWEHILWMTGCAWCCPSCSLNDNRSTPNEVDLLLTRR